MANTGNPSGPYIIWRNAERTAGTRKADWFTSRVENERYEVRQQQDSGRWALVAVFTIMRRAA